MPVVLVIYSRQKAGEVDRRILGNINEDYDGNKTERLLTQ